MIRQEIKGIQEIQRDNARAIAALKPEGKLGRAIKYIATDLHRYEVAITHVDTGALRAAHLMRLLSNRAELYVSPQAVNPRSRVPVTQYASIEEARGGSHAFRSRTINERGEYAVAMAIATVLKGVFE